MESGSDHRVHRALGPLHTDTLLYFPGNLSCFDNCSWDAYYSWPVCQQPSLLRPSLY